MKEKMNRKGRGEERERSGRSRVRSPLWPNWQLKEEFSPKFDGLPTYSKWNETELTFEGEYKEKTTLNLHGIFIVISHIGHLFLGFLSLFPLVDPEGAHI